MSIREEFEKAYNEIDCDGELGLDKATFLEGAKWMAERCAKECDNEYEYFMSHDLVKEAKGTFAVEKRIKEIIKELSNDQTK